MVRTWDSLPHAQFCIKKSFKEGVPLCDKFIPKISNFGDLRNCKPILFKLTRVNFGVMVQTRDCLPVPNFVKIAQGDLSLRANCYQKFEILAILSYLISHFHTYNV